MDRLLIFVWYDLPDGDYSLNCSSNDQYSVSSSKVLNYNHQIPTWNQMISINRMNETQLIFSQDMISPSSTHNYPIIGCSPLLDCDLNHILQSIQLMESQDHFSCFSPRSQLDIQIQLNESSSYELEGFSSSLQSHLNVGSTSILIQGSSIDVVDSSSMELNGVEMRLDDVDLSFNSQLQKDFISFPSGSLQISNSYIILPLISSSPLFSPQWFHHCI